MNPVTENPLLNKLHSDIRFKIKAKFKEITDCSHDNILFLYKYIDAPPSNFYLQSVYEIYNAWLFDRDNANRTQFQNYIDDNIMDISRALMHLDEINAQTWYDEPLPDSDIERIRFIDKFVHPSYLRLVEGVFAQLAHCIAFFSRIDRGKHISGLDIWNIVEELIRGGFSEISIGYNNIIRNGIAHGGITYQNLEIRYRDKKGNEETYDYYYLVRLHDDLLDICNALAAALSVFLVIKMGEGYRLPQQILYEELRARTKTPYWNVETCIPSMSMKGNQLIVYVNTNTGDYNKVQLSVFQTGILAGVLAPGYKRYFVSIQSKVALPGWAAFNGEKIDNLVQQGEFEIQGCGEILEDNIIYYMPKYKFPRIISTMNTFYLAARINVPLEIKEFYKHLGLASIDVRHFSIHRNGWRIVLNGEIIINGANGVVDKFLIYKSLRRIVRKALKMARQNQPIWNIQRYLSIGYVYLSVFECNYRKRRLSSFGLGSDLVCTIRVQRIKRIKSPDIIGSTIEIRGKYRIAWNKQWLEKNKYTSK